MLSRILWIGLAVVALIAGLAYQNRFLIGFDHDRIADHVGVVAADGRKIEVPRETKQAMAAAVRSFVSAKTELALLRARDADPQDIRAAEQRSEAARARIEKVKADIDRQRDLPQGDRDALRALIQHEVHQSVRDAASN